MSSSPWVSSTANDRERDFLVSANLYLSAQASATLRKPAPSKKKGDKRDFPNTYVEDTGGKKKASWLAVARGSTAGGQWRTVTVKLSEEGERCMLNIYVDDSFLYQTIFLHLLNHTDIRQVDTSLFLRKDCIAIYSTTSQRWCSSPMNEPVYLQFANRDACASWLALFRSYAVPEVYGRWFYHTDGGSYRMWRQVDLTVSQARNIGSAKTLYDRRPSLPNITGDGISDQESADTDVFCEIKLNNILCGRTTVKRRSQGMIDWHESFTFPDLPPFDELDIPLWKEKKNAKTEILGHVSIPLQHFRRGEIIDAWYPVVSRGPVAGDVHIGDLRLKITVEEEIVLPLSAYNALLKTLTSRNLLDWTTDLDNRLKVKNLSHQLMSIAVAKNVLVEQVADLAEREVESSATTKHTLFRGNTTFTKTMEACLTFYGKPFLEASVGTVVRRLCAENISIEIDPIRSAGKSPREMEKSVDLLIHWCGEFWKQIYSVRAECPIEIRKMFAHIRRTVEKKYGNSEPLDDTPSVSWQSISAFCFLRFIVPAVLHPHLFGLCPGLPPIAVQRTLTLIAKSLQSLANMNMNQPKEEFMRSLSTFLKDSKVAMIDYIHYISTYSPTEGNTPQGSSYDRQDRTNLVNAVRQRAQTMPILDREAIPALPYLLDIPRHLAVITSAVLRNSKEMEQAGNQAEPRDRQLIELCSRCFEIEENALNRVTHLASKVSAAKQPTPAPTSALSRVPTSEAEPAVYGSSPRRPRRLHRPSSAPPSDSEAAKARHRIPVLRGDPTLYMHTPERSPPLESRGRVDPLHNKPTRHRTHKTLSSESIPAFHRNDDVHSHIPPTRRNMDDDTSDDGARKKKGILRGFLRRD
ncbi:Rho GTPase activation protein [Pterulicium gracile]|uniref:Rho GTPase activation protein n=1 Tax=Pterulicium gracile TaxID=1884261 RepID=A0A5C3QYX4_9AGAR|nr:Rho GTPase activation protein [Pterula gracilis]